MTADPRLRVFSIARRQLDSAIFATITIGLLVLAGWVLGIQTFVRIVPDLPETKPNASLGLIASGIALWLLRTEPGQTPKRIIGLLLGLMVALLGLLSLSQDLFGWNLGIDISIRTDFVSNSVYANTPRISPGAAVNFILLGVALAMLAGKSRRFAWALQSLAFLAFLISAEALGGYIYRAHQLYRPMGFLAAVGTGVLSLGVLAARPKDAFMGLLTARSAGGVTLRRLLPLVFLVPMVLAWMRLIGQRAGLFDFEFGVELLVMSSVVSLAVILWWNSRSIHRIETERVQAQELVRTSSLYARSLIEASIDPLVTINAEGKITDVNQASVVATGITREQLIGTDFSNYFTDPRKASEGYKKVLLNGFVRDYPLTIRHSSGKITDVLYNASIYRDEEGKALGVFAAARDITERKRAEQEIKRLLRVYTVLSNINEAIVRIHEPQDLFRESCRVAVETGKMRLAWIGQLDEVTRRVKVAAFAGSPPDYVETIDIDMGDEKRSRGPTGTAIKSGFHCVSGDIRTDPAMAPWRARAERYGFRSSASFPMKVSGKIWGAFNVYSDEAGFFNEDEIRLIDELVADISFAIEAGNVESERRQAEEKIHRLNEELEERVLERTGQLEAANRELEAFAYSVSHDLRAPLRHVDGFIGLLEKDLGPDLGERSVRHLHTISDSAKRMGTLIDDLLTFSRMSRQEMHSTKISLSRLVKEVIEELAGDVEGRSICWKIHELPTVVGDKAMIKLVFTNLVSNAQKFTRKRSDPQIEIGFIDSNAKELTFFVRDNGVGFDMEYVHKLFGVFQRLHNERDFEGTGIGLANVRRIIDRHGGRTWAEGIVNGGATFFFTLTNAD